MASKKYISLDKLNKYHGKLVTVIDEKDQSILSQSKEYANSLAENYDAAGAAAGVQANLDKEVARATAAEQANAAAAKKAQDEVDALEGLVGTLPEGTTATSVVDYVNVKTAGIATDAALEELNNQLAGAQEAIDAIEADYLKASDKEELATAIVSEESRAKGVESGLDTRVKTIESDYLKAADKTELTDTINANKAILDAVKEDVDAFFADADLTESAKDTLKELQEYIASDESGAAAMAENIQKNKDDITAEAAKVATLQSDMTQAKTDIDNAEAKIAELETAIGEGGNVAEQISAAVATEKAERVAADEALQSSIDSNKEAADKTASDLAALTTTVGTKAAQADLEALGTRVTTVEGKVSTVEGKVTTIETSVGTLQTDLDAAEEKIAANEQAIATNTTAIGTKANQSALEAEVTRATAAEQANAAAIAEFVEASEEEINAIFSA